MMRSLLLSLLFLVTFHAAELPAAEALKNAEKAFRDLFGKDYDRINNYKGTEAIMFDGLRLDSDGELHLDGVWLGRSLRDLDRLQPRPLD